MKTQRLILAVTLLAISVLPAFAQTGQERVCLEQMHSLHKKTFSFFQRVDAGVVLSGSESVAIQEEIIAVSKLLHRLEEEASGLNVKELVAGRKDISSLLFISHGAAADALALDILYSFVSTRKSDFLVLAKAARGLAEKIDGAL
jgi:hypothetical protein